MANTYSSNLRLIIQTTGENAGTWGTYTNTNIATLLEQAITGIGAIAVSGSSNYTLSTANGASDESRNAILNVTGTLTAAINIVCPTVSKTYIIKNGTTGGFAVTLKTSAGTGISVPNGSTMFLYCDGTNVVEAVNYQTTGKFSSLTDTGLTSGRVTYAGAGGLLQDSTNLTFDGTTLTAGGLATAGNLTLSSLTANGVLYLNGSKVATSGSALTFDGTNLTIAGGVGTAQPALRIKSISANSQGFNVITNSSTDDVSLVNYYNAGLIFGVNNAEGMRLTSTGLGIGTSSPSAKLQSYTSAAGQSSLILTSTNGSGSGKAATITVGNNSAANGGGFGLQVFDKSDNAGGNQTGYGIYVSAPYDGANASGNTYGLTKYGIYVDDIYSYYGANSGAGGTNWGIYIKGGANNYIAGNLGLGVTPSGWSSSIKAFDFGSTGSLYAVSDLVLAHNAYVNSGGSWTYKTTAGASYLQEYAGAFKFFTAPSGTAGAAISFTQAMTLDASGRLVIGASSASGSDILSAYAAAGAAGGEVDFAIYDTTASKSIRLIRTGGTYSYAGMGATEAALYTASSNLNLVADGGVIKFNTGTLGSAAERMRLDSSGNLRIGASADGLWVGSEKLTVSGYSLFKFSDTPALVWNTATSGTRSLLSFSVNTSRLDVGSITSNGTTTSYNTSSDYRLKNITSELTGYKERILALQPKQGTWKADGAEFRGFLAHEFAEQYPSAVSGEKDAVDEDGNPKYQGMQAGGSETIADLVALIKDLVAEIETLKQQLGK